MIYKTSEADEWLIDEDVTTVESADDETCGMLVTTTREVDVTEDIDGYIYACEIVTQDNTTYRSDVKEVSIQVPGVYCYTGTYFKLVRRQADASQLIKASIQFNVDIDLARK